MEVWRRIDDHEVTVEAVRLTEKNVRQVGQWCKAEPVMELDPEDTLEEQPALNVETPRGVQRCSLGMYVIKVGPNFLVMHNRQFEIKYEPTTRPAPPLESAGDSRKARGFADPFDIGRMSG